LVTATSMLSGVLLVPVAPSSATNERRSPLTASLANPEVQLGEHPTLTGRAATQFRRKVVLQRAKGGAWAKVATTLTSRMGRYRITDPVARDGVYRVICPRATHKRRSYGRLVSGTATAKVTATLTSGQGLDPGRGIVSPSQRYRLIMQGDGNLVIYEGSTARWNSQTAGRSGARLIMQGDGNLVIYLGATAVWNSRTAGFSGTRLQLQDDGNLVLYQGSKALWSTYTGTVFNQLRSGHTLSPGDIIWSEAHRNRLVMQGDGNLVLYQGSAALWNSQTAGHPGARAVMQSDGNLVVYLGDTALWHSHTAGHNGARLILQDDDNLVVYEGSTALWSWKTGLIGSPPPSGASDATTRAQSWVDVAVPYNQATSYTNQFGTYRTDCSGFVSMAWALPSSYTTFTLPSVSHPIAKADLQPGDILLNTTSHVVIFRSWANAEKTEYWAYEQTPPKAIYHKIPYPYWPGYGTYSPYRKN